MREWILDNGIASQEELEIINAKAKAQVRQSRDKAWYNYIQPIKDLRDKAVELIESIQTEDDNITNQLKQIVKELKQNREPLRRDILSASCCVKEIVNNAELTQEVENFYEQQLQINSLPYNSQLYNEGPKSALKVPEVKPSISPDASSVNGYEILNRYFDQLFASNPYVLAFGEDVGKIGDVNQGFAGLQDKHGINRIFDTGIREQTIIGQGTGLAFRGLRPIAEIQYIDYLLFALQTLSDDVSTLHYRTAGKQSCPLIVRTRGHRLEGIWHSGSPMGMIINALRGMYVCVPRNMVQAVGMYNTMLQSNDPAIIIECLNGYRLKEKLPENLLEFTVPLGVPEIIRQGSDVTIVSYGSTLRIVEEAVIRLQKQNISCEIVDVQTLLPFDIHHKIVKSLKKTNRIVFIDEDVPGGAAAYMFNHVMEKQGGYRWLDVAPRTITAKAHRPSYGSDGDYFSKPNTEEIIEVISQMMRE
jgi:pyruvate/2-oxoglutarate/acetoin dehydrogenase E1 component